MKRKLIVVMAMGMLSIGALSASAADACEACADKQTVRQFTQETAALAAVLQAKERELRMEISYERIDTNKTRVLEAELKELKDKINAVASRYGLPACSHS